MTEVNDQADDSAALLNFVASRDTPCPACGYNLRMLRKPACPECGLPLKLTVGSDEPFKRAWAIMLCLSAMIAGIGGFFLIITLVTSDSPLEYERSAIIWYLMPMLWIPVPVVLFFLRRLFCKLESTYQYLIIGITLLAMLAIVVTFISSVT